MPEAENSYEGKLRFLKTPHFLFIAALLLAAGLSFFTDLPERDVAACYAPMADAFASGEWAYAFHPRTTPLLPVTAGTIALLLGCTGFMAAKLASSLFFAAGVYPLFGIFKRVFDLKTAWFAVLLYVLASHVLRLASSGLRETSKGFAFFLAVYGLIVLFQERRRIFGYLWLALGSGALILCRGDGFLYAFSLFAAAGALEFWNSRSFQFPWRALAAGLLALLIASPFLAYNYKMLGYPVPEGRFVDAICKLESKLKEAPWGLDEKPAPAEGKADAPAAPDEGKFLAATDTSSEAQEQKVNNIPSFLVGLFKGFYPYFAVIAIPVIAFRLARRRMSLEEKIILAALLGHAFLLVLQIAIHDHYLYVSRRYLLSIAPLSFGWTALGVFMVVDKLKTSIPDRHFKPACCGVLSVLAIALLADAAGPLLKNVTSKKKGQARIAVLEASAWIKSDFKGPAKKDFPFDAVTYSSNRLPIVFEGDFHGAGYLSGGQAAASSQLKEADYLLLKDKGLEAELASSGYELGRSVKAGSLECYVFRRRP